MPGSSSWFPNQAHAHVWARDTWAERVGRLLEFASDTAQTNNKWSDLPCYFPVMASCSCLSQMLRKEARCKAFATASEDSKDVFAHFLTHRENRPIAGWGSCNVVFQCFHWVRQLSRSHAQSVAPLITFKDHKKNFTNAQPCRLINPAKSELSKVSNAILDKILAAVDQKVQHCRGHGLVHQDRRVALSSCWHSWLLPINNWGAPCKGVELCGTVHHHLPTGKKTSFCIHENQCLSFKKNVSRKALDYST